MLSNFIPFTLSALLKKFSAYFLLFLLMLGLSGNAVAQYTEFLRSDRPGRAISPITPGKNIFILQSGGLYRTATNPEGVEISSIVSETQFRWGLLTNVELNTSLGFRRDRLTIGDSLERHDSGLSDLQVGARLKLYEGERLVPTIGLQFAVLLNVLSSSFNPQDAAPSFLVVTQQTLSDNIFLTTNVGMAWNGNNSDPLGNYSINLKGAVNNKMGLMVENYSSFDKNNFNTYIHSGLYYFLNNNFQVDLSGGYGRYAGNGSFFVTAGFSWRFKRNYYYYQEYSP